MPGTEYGQANIFHSNVLSLVVNPVGVRLFSGMWHPEVACQKKALHVYSGQHCSLTLLTDRLGLGTSFVFGTVQQSALVVACATAGLI